MERCTTLNPSTLIPIHTDGTPHACLSETTQKVLPWPELTHTPYSDAQLTMFVLLMVLAERTRAVVRQDTVVMAKPLPKGKSATIYTDKSICIFNCLCVCSAVENRGMVTSTGKSINHKDLILNLLAAIYNIWIKLHSKTAFHTEQGQGVFQSSACLDLNKRGERLGLWATLEAGFRLLTQSKVGAGILCAIFFYWLNIFS